MKDWIETRRKELRAQRDQHVANVNACDGALQMLDAAETEMNKPKDAPAKEVTAFDKHIDKALAKARG